MRKVRSNGHAEPSNFQSSSVIKRDFLLNTRRATSEAPDGGAAGARRSATTPATIRAGVEHQIDFVDSIRYPPSQRKTITTRRLPRDQPRFLQHPTTYRLAPGSLDGRQTGFQRPGGAVRSARPIGRPLLPTSPHVPKHFGNFAGALMPLIGHPARLPHSAYLFRLSASQTAANCARRCKHLAIGGVGNCAIGAESARADGLQVVNIQRMRGSAKCAPK